MGTCNRNSLRIWNALGIVLGFYLYLPINGVAALNEHQQNRSMYYVCPPDFIRLGNSCYYFSPVKATWQDAHFACKDRESNLTSPQRWEDRKLREYLNTPEVEKQERWIGGVYDWEAKVWKWGGELRTMKYQSFSRMRHLPDQDLRWHCVAMIPDLQYRWAPMSCVEGKNYICQTRLRKVPKSERNKLRQRWNPNGTGHKPNEISVPRTVDYENYNRNEVNPSNDLNPVAKLPEGRRKPDQRNNDVSPSSDSNAIPEYLLNVGKTAYAHRQGGKNSGTRKTIRKKPFRGFVSNKEDPEAAYIHNVNALRSGKSGLTAAQIDKHLRRLERLRKKEERNKLRKERLHDQQNRHRNAQSDGDLPDSALASKVNNIRSRNLIDGAAKSRDPKKQKNKKIHYTFENVTQKTYVVDNQLSDLHPKTIVEVHE
nr:C-type lectin domain containing 46kDa protein [Limnephilus flavicornis]